MDFNIESRCDESVLSRIFIVCCWIPLRLPGAIIVTDYLLLETILRRLGANTIHVSFTTEFFRTRIYRIQADKIDINVVLPSR